MQEKVYKYLDNLGISYEINEHPPLFTCADHDKYGLKLDCRGCKNLFLRNHKKKNYYLVSMPDDKRVDLKELAVKLNEKGLSFGNEEELLEKLGVTPGSVSVLNIIEKCDIIFIGDRDLLDESRVGFHPNINTITLIFSGKSLEEIVRNKGIEYKFIEI